VDEDDVFLSVITFAELRHRIERCRRARAMLTADGSDGSHVFVAMRKALLAAAHA
jgi:hypothetical protein